MVKTALHSQYGNSNDSVFPVDINNTPIVEIDNVLYKFDKCFGPWQSAKFTKIQDNFSDDLITNKKSKIESFYS